MKAILSLSIFMVLSVFAPAQKTDSLISIQLKNTSLLPKRVTVVSYSPDEAGNGTQIFTVLPGREQSLQFKAGTKLYLANKKQANSVMSGKRIDTDQPFLIVKAIDNKKTFKL